jgi:hypothetical protein
MKWIQQALHVARKDVRLMKWSLVLYVVGVLLMATLALGTIVVWGQLFWAGGLCVIGALIAGAIVHADSPTRVDAFWATRPLSPGAVYSGKVLALGLVLLAPVVAELSALLSHDIAMSSALQLLVRPAAVYVALLATAVMVAVLTPDFRIFVAAFIALFVVQSIGSQLLPWFFENDVIPAPIMYALAFGGMIALGAWQYHTRSPRRGLVFAALLVVLTMLIPGSMSAQGRAERVPLAMSLDTVLVRVEAEPLRRTPTRWILPVRLTLTGASSDQMQYGISIHDVSVRIGGELIQLPTRSMYIEATGARRTGYTWLQGNDATFSVDVPDALRTRVISGDASVVVHALVITEVVETLIDVPVRAGAHEAARGNRLRIASVTREPVLEIVVGQSIVPVNDRRVSRGDGFELVSRERGEALSLTTADERVSDGALVLPASHGTTRSVMLSAGRQRARIAALDDAWLEGARLRYVRRYVEGEYATSAESPIPRN